MVRYANIIKISIFGLPGAKIGPPQLRFSCPALCHSEEPQATKNLLLGVQMFRCAQHDKCLLLIILYIHLSTETACRLCHARRRETSVVQLRICFTASSLRGLLSPWQSEQNHTVSPPFPAEHRNALRCHLRRPASEMRPAQPPQMNTLSLTSSYFVWSVRPFLASSLRPFTSPPPLSF